MEIVSVVIQCFIGLIFTIYGIWSLLSNRKKGEQAKGKFVLSLVCILVGIFLLGYAVCQFVSNEPKAGANDIIADKKVPCQFFFLECVLQKSHKKVLP